MDTMVVALVRDGLCLYCLQLTFMNYNMASMTQHTTVKLSFD